MSSTDEFANSLDSGQAQQNVGSALDPNCLTPWRVSNFNDFFVLELISLPTSVVY